MSEGRILVVDDDRALRDLLVEDLAERGFTLVEASSAEAALMQLELGPIDVVITDLRMPGQGGMHLCRQISALDPSLPVILMTAFGSMDLAIEAIRSGAYDFLIKPFDLEQLALAVERATSLRALRAELTRLRASVREAHAGGHLQGTSPVMARLRESVAQIAATQATVLVRGEVGVGKALVSRELHELGPRAQAPLVVGDLAAIPADRMEATLAGLLQRAHGGTLLLREVDALSLEAQLQLLHALEARRVRRPADPDHDVSLDVRIIATTHRDLEAAVRLGRFRRDLLFRLSVFELDVPPLRDRGRDALLLAHLSVDEQARAVGRLPPSLHPETAAALLAWSWPGNVRELHRVMADALLRCHGPEILPGELPAHIQQGPSPAPPDPGAEALELLSLEVVEKRHILEVLAALGGNKAQAARILGIGRKTLYRKLEQWGELGPDEVC